MIDEYRELAAAMYKVPYHEVTAEQRYWAKTLKLRNMYTQPLREYRENYLRTNVSGGRDPSTAQQLGNRVRRPRPHS